MNEMHDHLRQGRETYTRHAWHDAYHAFLCADEATPLEADGLERLATAAYLIGRELEFIRLIEHLHQIHLEADNSERAARCAFWLALSSSKIYHMSNCPDYSKVSERNRVPFKTEAEAQAAGYRKAKNCPQ